MTGRHAKPWNLARRLHDKQFPRLIPGNHHPYWDTNVTKVALEWKS